MRWTWPLRGLGLVLVAAATAVVVLGVRSGTQTGQPRAEPSRADRQAALLADADYPGEYELEPFTDAGADAFEPDDVPRGFGPSCDGLDALVPAFPGDRTGVAMSASVPPGPYEDANWESTDYLEAIGATRDATWDPARAEAFLDGCATATTEDGKVTITVRRLDPPRPGALAARVSYRQSDGVRFEMAHAVVPVGGQLVVLYASTFDDLDEDMFTRLATAAAEKAVDHLG
jgi:hypothetical protein